MSGVEVRIYEVGPRDGLQSEATLVPTEVKRRFIDLLADAGLREIEATSFVSPTAVPQLADADDLFPSLERRPGVRYPVLVPNQRGFDRALAAGADAICLFTAATDEYARANIGMSIDDSLATFAPLAAAARGRGMWIRGYLSVAFGCPYSGEVEPAAVVAVAQRLAQIGVDEISVSDTLGVATPTHVARVLAAITASGIGPDRLALHLHDTRGTSLANVMAGLAAGVRTFDASAAGIGGSPFAPGAAGNLATEDLVYLLDREGVRTDVDLDAVLVAARFIGEALGHPPLSKLGRAGPWPTAE